MRICRSTTDVVFYEIIYEPFLVDIGRKFLRHVLQKAEFIFICSVSLDLNNTKAQFVFNVFSKNISFLTGTCPYMQLATISLRN